MKKTTAAQDGSSITERMEINHNASALKAVDESGLSSALERLMDYKSSSATAFAGIDNPDDDDPFADPAPKAGSGIHDDDGHDPMADFNVDDFSAPDDAETSPLEDVSSQSGGLDNYDPNYQIEDDDAPSAERDEKQILDDAVSISNATDKDQFNDIDAASIETVSGMDDLLGIETRRPADSSADNSFSDLLGDDTPPPSAAKREDVFDDFLSNDDTFKLDSDGFGEEAGASDSSYKTPEPEIPGSMDDAFGGIYGNDDANLDDSLDINLDAELESATTDSVSGKIDEPVKVEAPVRLREARLAPDETKDMPEDWEVGKDDPSSAAAALFSVTDEVTETTSEGNDGEKIVKKTKTGLFGKMFGGKKVIKKTKTTETVVTTQDTQAGVPDALFEDVAESEVVETKAEKKAASKPKSGTIKKLLAGTAVVALLALGGGYIFLSQSDQPYVVSNVTPLPASDGAETPANQLGLPGDDLPAVAAPGNTLGLPGDPVPAETDAVQLPNADEAAAPVVVTEVPGINRVGDPVGEDLAAATPDAVMDMGDVSVEADATPADGVDALYEDIGIDVNAGETRLRADLDTQAAKIESIETRLPQILEELGALREALQIRDAALESQDSRIATAMQQSSEARQVAEDQNMILLEFAQTKEDVSRGLELDVDLSRRVSAIEGTATRIDDLNREVAQLRRDVANAVRVTLGPMSAPVTVPTAPPVPPAPSSAPVYQTGDVPLSLPMQVEVPADVKIGDVVPNGGTVLDIVPMENQGRLVIMEEAQVMID